MATCEWKTNQPYDEAIDQACISNIFLHRRLGQNQHRTHNYNTKKIGADLDSEPTMISVVSMKFYCLHYGGRMVPHVGAARGLLVTLWHHSPTIIQAGLAWLFWDSLLVHIQVQVCRLLLVLSDHMNSRTTKKTTIFSLGDPPEPLICETATRLPKPDS
jgi:hypothetical protein